MPARKTSETRLEAPLVSNIAIRKSPEKEMFVIIGRDESFSPPNATAEITTYEIALTLRSDISAPTESEKNAIKESLERTLDAAEEHESFPRYQSWSYRGMRHTYHGVNINWSKTPPEVKVHGSFTLDMLNGFFDLNLFETNLDIAKTFKQASQQEMRSPLMSALGKDHEWGDEYDPFPSTEKFTRKNIDIGTSSSIGDLSGVPQHERYAKLIRDIREAIPRDRLSEVEFRRLIVKAAILTLENALPSPYPSARQLLGGEKAEKAPSPQELLEERVSQVISDIVGEGYYFYVPQEGIVEVETEKGPKPLTFQQLKEILRDKLKTEMNQGKGKPEWWLGTTKEWERDIQEAFHAARTSFDEAIGISPKDSDESRAKKYAALGQRLIAELEEAAKRQNPDQDKESGTTEVQLYGELLRLPKDADLSFVGMSYPATHSLDPHSSYRKELQPADYQSRNPVLDTPRPIPAPLQRLLDQEKDRNKKRPLMIPETVIEISGSHVPPEPDLKKRSGPGGAA